MKTVWFATGLLLAASCALGADDRPAKGKDEASVWMTRKLEFSKNVLAGLTRGDFELVRKNAEAMRVVGYLEMWDRANLPEYRRQIRYFDDANKELLRQAASRNINGATLAYTQLTLSCVHCHSIIRDGARKPR